MYLVYGSGALPVPCTRYIVPRFAIVACWTNILDFMAPPNLVNFPKLRGMTIQKATFAPSKPCTIHFEGLESGTNGSTRVRRLTRIYRY
jgi:hypothetical protein